MSTENVERPLALAVDDDALMRDICAAALEAQGYRVVQAGDGSAGWDAYRQEGPELVVLDIAMPGIDGLELCRRIRGAERSAGREGMAFLLVVTSHDTDEVLDRVLDAGADDYLSKPVALPDLRARLTIARRRIALAGARRAAEAALQRARYLAGIGETTLALQHEINNPLAALMGHAMLLEGSVAGESGEHVSVIVEQAHRIAAVVQRLSELKEPKAVDYVGGAKMLDLREQK